MSKYYQHAILVVIAGFFLTGMAGHAMAQKHLFEAYKKVIVIDPGHGGDESGARGADGTAEKAVTLSLAKILAAELKREYRVVLTRTDDIQMNLVNRTATANHHKADLFISIHTGGSFVHGSSGILIYHYQDFSEDSRKHGQNMPTQRQNANAPVLWDRAQSKYLEKSRLLAGLINTRLNGLSEVNSSRLQGAPLLLLQGANMPAILIEIGYLTNPSEEKRLNDRGHLTGLARKISRGIDEYFDQEQ
ncbi:MAG: N-acetylmuramoyl-L-alanine amidase [bacterium]|nr:N-acetylmuramoyl-L-alanine amidase [bacterium]